MLHLRARPLQTARALVLGPAPFFKVDGSVLRQGPGEQIVGRYQDQHWEFATQFLSSFEVTDPTTVRFEDANGQRSAAFGPFHRLHFPNGSCYADEQPFAEFLSRNECWRHAGERRAWPVILICPARV